MALSKIPSAGFQDNVKFRNIIINGDMSIAQRSTSVSGISGSNGLYNTIDRWRTNFNNLGTWTQSQSTDVPSAQGFVKSLKMDCTTADASPSASEYMIIETQFEGQNLQYLKKGTSSAESLTLSFWIKSSKTGDFVVEIDDNDNSRHINKLYTINSANTWEKKIITYVGDTSGTLDNDNNSSIRVMFWFGAGTDYTSGTLQTSWGSQNNTNRAVGCDNMADSTSNEFYITGVQLEAGTTASDFEFLPFDVNFNKCKRYFERSYNYGTATGTGTTTGILQMEVISAGTLLITPIGFEVEKRTTPSFVTYDGVGNVNKVTTSNGDNKNNNVQNIFFGSKIIFR
jgi:hypothetical protein